MYSRNFTGGQSNPAGFITACLGIPASAKRFHRSPSIWLTLKTYRLSASPLAECNGTLGEKLIPLPNMPDVFLLFVADKIFFPDALSFLREEIKGGRCNDFTRKESRTSLSLSLFLSLSLWFELKISSWMLANWSLGSGKFKQKYTS